MARLRSHLVEEAASIKKSEQARKQRELKKYGKEIQHEKLKQRVQDKKGLDERLRGVKRKRKDGAELGGEEGDFDVALDDAIDGKGKAGKGGKDGKDGKRGDKDPRVSRIPLTINLRPLTHPHRCRVTHETASTAWAAAASGPRRTTASRQTTSTFPRARAGPEVQRAPRGSLIGRESRGETTSAECSGGGWGVVSSSESCHMASLLSMLPLLSLETLRIQCDFRFAV
jgi:hypothetical protein